MNQKLKNIEAKDRLIFACDVPTMTDAKKIVDELGDSISFYKIGLELLMSKDYFKLLDWLIAKDKKVFVDLKFFDVPQTVSSAIKQLSKSGATLATIHGNDSMMKAATEHKANLKVLAVTALTSLDQGDLKDLGFKCNVEQLVLSRAKRALENGCDGVVSSGLEVKELRKSLDEKLLVVCPGIRPVDNNDDQKRTVNIGQAFKNGADYIVVGRPIREPVKGSPKETVEQMQQTIARIFTN